MRLETRDETVKRVNQTEVCTNKLKKHREHDNKERSVIINKQTTEKNNEKVVTREIVQVVLKKKRKKNKSFGSRTVHLKLLMMRMMSSSRDQ